MPFCQAEPAELLQLAGDAALTRTCTQAEGGIRVSGFMGLRIQSSRIFLVLGGRHVQRSFGVLGDVFADAMNGRGSTLRVQVPGKASSPYGIRVHVGDSKPVSKMSKPRARKEPPRQRVQEVAHALAGQSRGSSMLLSIAFCLLHVSSANFSPKS